MLRATPTSEHPRSAGAHGRRLAVSGRQCRISALRLAALVGILAASGAAAGWGQSPTRYPRQPSGFVELTATTQSWLGNANTTGSGDLDRVNVIFFEIPSSVTSDLYFAVKDPGANGTIFPDYNNFASGDPSTTFTLIGGQYALTGSTARERLYATTSQAYQGDTLGSISRTNEVDAGDGWVYFGGVNPALGELVGNKRYFKIVVEVGSTAGSIYKNGYQVDVSYSGSGVPTGVAGGLSFTYGACLILQDRAAAPGSANWMFYPFVPDTAADANYVFFHNYDFDDTGLSPNVTLRELKKTQATLVPGAAADTQASASGDSATISTGIQVASAATEANGTWRYDIYEGNVSITGTNLAEVWFTFSTDGTASADDAIVRAYSGYYAPAPADHVGISPASRTVITGSNAVYTLQVLDASGNPVPYARAVTVTVTAPATINATGLQSTVVNTDSNGYASFYVTSGSPTVALDITLATAWGTGTDGQATVQFVDDPAPTIAMASHLTYTEGGGDTLIPTITIADSGPLPGSIDESKDIRIRFSSSLTAAFVTPPAPVYGGTAGAVQSTIMEGSTLLIQLSPGYVMGDLTTIGNLFISSVGDAPSSGRLEMSVNGAGGPWIPCDKLITILDPNPPYIWTGANSSSWSDTLNWNPNGDPNSTTANVVIPVAASGRYPVLAANRTVKNITIYSGAPSLTLGNFNLTIAAGGSLQNAGTIVLNGTGRPSVGDADSGTVRYTSAAGGSVADFGTADYYDLELSPAAAATFTVGNPLTVANNLTVGANATLELASNGLSVDGVVSNAGVVRLTGVAAQTIALANGNDTDTGTWNYTEAAAAVSIRDFSGATDYCNLTVSGASALFATPGSIGLGGNYVQTAGTVTLAGDLTVAGTKTVSSGTVLDVSTHSVLGTNGFTNNGTVRISGGGQTIAGTKTNGNPSIVEYYGAGAGMAWGGSYHHLTLAGSGTFPAGGAIDVNGNLALTGGQLSMTTNDLTVAGSITRGTGTINSGAAVILDGSGGQTVDFTSSTLLDLDVRTTGTGVSLAANAAMTRDLFVNAAGRRLNKSTFNLDVDRHTNAASGTLDLGGSGTLNVGGNLTLGALLNAAGSTVILDGALAQALTPNGQTFGDVRIFGADVTMAGTATFGSLWIDATKSFTLGEGAATTLTTSGTVTVDGTLLFNSTGNTVRLAPAGGTSIANNGVIRVEGSTTTVDIVSPGTVTMSGTQQIDLNGCALSLSGFSTTTPHTLEANDILTIAGPVTFSGGFTLNGALSQLNVGGSTLNATGGLTVTNGTATMGGGTLNVGTAALTVDGGILTFSAIPVSVSCGALDLTLGSVNNDAVNTISVSGDVEVACAFNTPANSTINMMGAGTTINASSTIGSLNVSGATATVSLSTNDLSLAGSLNVAAGRSLSAVDGAVSRNISLAGDWTVSGTGAFDAGTGTVTFTLGSAQSLNAGGVDANHDFNNLTVNKSALAVTLGAPIAVGGKLTISSGALDVSASNHQITISGNWENAVGDAGFEERAGTVFCDGITLITGAERFYDLSIDAAGAVGADGLLTVANGLSCPGNFTSGAGGLLVLGNADFTDGTLNGASALGVDPLLEFRGNLIFSGSSAVDTNEDVILFSGGTTPQTFTPGGKAFDKLTVNKTAGTVVQMNDNASVAIFTQTSGNFTILAGRRLTVDDVLPTLADIALGAGTFTATGELDATDVAFEVPTGVIVAVGTSAFRVGAMTVSGGTFTQTGDNAAVHSAASLDVSAGSCTWASITPTCALDIPGAIIVSGTGSLAFGPKTVAAGSTVGMTAGTGTLNLRSTTLNAQGAVTVSAGTLLLGPTTVTTTEDDVTITQAVVLGTLAAHQVSVVTGSTVAGNGDIAFGAVDGPGYLTANAGASSVSFSGNLGGTTALASVSATSTNPAANAITIRSVRAAGAQQWTGNVTLGADAALQTSGTAITFTGALDGASRNLTLNAAIAAGVVDFQGAVSGLGTGTGAALTVQAGVTGQVRFRSTLGGASGIAAAGVPFRFDDDVTLADGNASTTLGAVTMDGLSFSCYDGFASGAMTLSSADVSVDSNGGTMTIASVVGGSQNLTLISGAGTLGVTGNIAALGTLTLQEDLASSTGTVTLSGSVSAAGIVTWAQGYAVTMTGGCAIASDVIFANTGALSLGDADADTFTFTGGMTARDTSSNAFRGTIATGGAAGQNLAFDDVTVGAGVAVAATCTLDAGAAGTVVVDDTSGGGTGTLSAAAAKRLNVTAASLTATAASIAGAGTIDLGSTNFSIGTLSSSSPDFAPLPGYFDPDPIGNSESLLRLTGTQTTHAIATNDVDSGIVEYYGTGGTVFAAGFLNGSLHYHDLRIAGTGTFALGGDVATARNVVIDSGILSLGANTLDVGDGWYNTTAGTTALDAGTGTVRFQKPSGTVYVYGHNTWCVFHCTVPGVTILFENAHVQRIVASGVFRVRGSAWGAGSQIDLNRITVWPVPPAAPADELDDDFWSFDFLPGATFDMRYVNVYFSNAILHPVAVPADVNAVPAPYYCYKWLNNIYTLYSFTEDSDYDGKIDRIRVTCETSINGDFSDFDVTVEGYEIDRTKAGSTRGFEHVGAGYVFYIWLVEKTWQDTDATPDWRIARNTTLRGGTKLVGTLQRAIADPLWKSPGDWMDPGDGAWPRLSYRLAVPLHNEGFVAFSEPIRNSGGSLPSAAELGFTAGPTVVVGTATELKEATGTIASPSLADLAGGASTLSHDGGLRDIGQAPGWGPNYVNLVGIVGNPTWPLDTGYGDPYGYTASATRPVFDVQRGADATTHRVSDLLVSVEPSTVAASWSALNPASYFVWPVWAKDSAYFPGTSTDWETYTPAEAASRTIGFVRAFDGSQWLRDQDWVLQARRHASGAAWTPSIIYDSNAPDTFRSAVPGIWLPDYAETDFAGLAAYPMPIQLAPGSSNAGIATGQVPATTSSGDLFNWKFSESDPKVFSVAEFEFWFRLGALTDLCAGRLDAPSGFAAMPADWYRRVRPFGLGIHDIKTQRGGVTILNNVIDPTKGERTRLNYTVETEGPVTIAVFTLDGDVVKYLYRGTRTPGDYTETWDGRNLSGAVVARGIYFIRALGPGFDEIRKVMVVK